MIFYFSATGNSKYVAQRLAEATGDTAVSILDWSGRPVSVSSSERLGIVTPDYCGGVPSVAADFLKTTRFELADDAELYKVDTHQPPRKRQQEKSGKTVNGSTSGI